jgi:hypothetical protein
MNNHVDGFDASSATDDQAKVIPKEGGVATRTLAEARARRSRPGRRNGKSASEPEKREGK